MSINYRPEGNYKAGQGRQYHEYPPGVEHEAAALPAEMVRDHKPGQPSHADITDLKHSAVTLKRGLKKRILTQDLRLINSFFFFLHGFPPGFPCFYVFFYTVLLKSRFTFILTVLSL